MKKRKLRKKGMGHIKQENYKNGNIKKQKKKRKSQSHHHRPPRWRDKITHPRQGSGGTTPSQMRDKGGSKEKEGRSGNPSVHRWMAEVREPHCGGKAKANQIAQSIALTLSRDQRPKKTKNVVR